jgi:hypothetical protein
MVTLDLCPVGQRQSMKSCIVPTLASWAVSPGTSAARSIAAVSNTCGIVELRCNLTRNPGMISDHPYRMPHGARE